MSSRLYYFRSLDGQPVGPVELNVVAEMIQAGRVKANTPVSLDGSVFKPMKAFPELATLLSVDVAEETPSDESAKTPSREATPTFLGDLSEVSLPKLLFHFVAAKTTGRLALTTPKIVKEVFLVNGKPVAATSNLERDQFGQHLIRHGVLDAQRLEQVLKGTRRGEMRMGDYLIDRGVLSREGLAQHLVLQLQEKIYEIFCWRAGRYSFYQNQQYHGSLLPMNLNPWEILTEGIRRGYELPELTALLAPYRHRVLLSLENPYVHSTNLGLTSAEMKVFDTANGNSTLTEVLAQMGKEGQDHRRILAVVYLGVELELLTFGGEITPDARQQTSLREQARAGERVKQAEPHQEKVEVHHQIAAIQTSLPVSSAESQLLETFNRLQVQDYFQRLGIARAADAKEATKAFLDVARTFHPDQIRPEAPETVRSLSARVFALINEAHHVLSNDKARADYLGVLEAGLDSDKIDVGNILESEKAFQRGEVLLKVHKYGEALQEFDAAIKLNPSEGEFIIYRGYALLMANPKAESSVQNQCLQLITKGLKLRDNAVPNGFLFLGRIYNLAGNHEQAYHAFKKVLALDPNHVEAVRELRLLGMRKDKGEIEIAQDKPTERKGLFRKR